MTRTPSAVDARAAQVRCELEAQDEAWRTRGWTRRSFLAGVGMAGVAALGSQLVTTRAAYAAAPSTGDRTLVIVFLRGALDGLQALVPNASALGLDYLNTVRPNLVPAAGKLTALPGQNGWALNSALQPLYDTLWNTGELAFVPGISTTDISRSHFQAQQYLEKGGDASATTGWLDRLLAQLGPGTTFRAVAEGSAAPASLAGEQPSLALSSLADFTFPGWTDIQAGSEAAVLAMYRGLATPLGEDVPDAIGALGTAQQIRSTPATTVSYPSGSFAASLQDLAAILRADVGMQVATVDVGGWDTHTDEVNQLQPLFSSFASSLAAFFADLGSDRRSRVTVAVMTEFGRRMMMNDSGGTDHGHGSVMWLMGGGLAGSGVYGKWNQLSDATADQGDVPGVNNPFDVLGELAQDRLGVGSLSTVFPGHDYAPLGLARAT